LIATLVGLVLLGVYAAFAPSTYRATARIVIEAAPGASVALPSASDTARRLKQAAFDSVLLAELGQQLVPTEPADKIKTRVEGMLTVTSAGGGAFDFVLLDSDAARARDICNSLARRAAGRANAALVGEPVDLEAKRKEVAQRAKEELATFLAAHPELAAPVVAPVTSAPPKGPSELQVSALRAERDKLQAKLAQVEAAFEETPDNSDNPYAESGSEVTQMRQRLREIDSILNPRRPVQRDKPRPKVEPDVEREWKRLLAAAEQPAPAEPVPQQALKVRLAEAPLPAWPLEAKQRLYLVLIGLVIAAAFLFSRRSRGAATGPHSSRRISTGATSYAATQPALDASAWPAGELPRFGTGTQPMSTVPPQMGSDPPRFGSDPPRFGSDAPGLGSEPPRIGSDPPRFGSDAPRFGSDAPGLGGELPRIGSDPPRRGSDPPRVGSDPPRAGREETMFGDTMRSSSNPPGPEDATRRAHVSSHPPRAISEPSGSDNEVIFGGAAQRADETPRAGSDLKAIEPKRVIAAVESPAPPPPVVPLRSVSVGARPDPTPTGREALPGSRTISSAPPPAAEPARVEARTHPASTLSGFAPMPIVPAPIHTPFPPAPDLTPEPPAVLEPFDTGQYPEAEDPAVEVHQAIVMTTVPPPPPETPLDPISVPRHAVRRSGALSDQERPSGRAADARGERPGAERRSTAIGPFSPGSNPNASPEESRRARRRPGRITQTLGSPITPPVRPKQSSVPPPPQAEHISKQPTPTGYSYVSPGPRSSPPRPAQTPSQSAPHTPPHYAPPYQDRPKYPSTPQPAPPQPVAQPQAERAKVQIRPVHAGWAPDPALRYERQRSLADELFPLAVDACLVIGVSAVPEARHYKTRIASELALALAEPRHQRVLLLEGDFQWPAVHEVMRIEMPFSAGFSQQLRARAQGGDSHIWTVVQCAPALHVLAEGIMRSPGLILSSHFEESLSSFRTVYDIVVVDGPLASLEVDSRAFDSVVDGLVLVSPVEGSSWLSSASSLFSEKRFSRVVAVGP
jgi:Mrp family chromosome partitioning ATPase